MSMLPKVDFGVCRSDRPHTQKGSKPYQIKRGNLSPQTGGAHFPTRFRNDQCQGRENSL